MQLKKSYTEKLEIQISLKKLWIVSDKSVLASIFNNYFASFVPNLDLMRPETRQLDVDLVIKTILTFKNHPSMLKIKKKKRFLQ